MSLPRVFKFGGTSVGSAERLAQVLRIVERERARSPLAVVVSAPGDTTDWLLEAGRLAASGELAAADGLVSRVGEVARSAVDGALAEPHEGVASRGRDLLARIGEKRDEPPHRRLGILHLGAEDPKGESPVPPYARIRVLQQLEERIDGAGVVLLAHGLVLSSSSNQ